jgi:hypothetical protein
MTASPLIDHARSFARTALFTGLVAVGAAGCSYDVFNDLADRAPVVRITQGGEISSASFGDNIIGLRRSDEEPGALLAVTGNADASFGFISFNGSGGTRGSYAKRDDLAIYFKEPESIIAMARAPSEPVDTWRGPFVYVGTQPRSAGTPRVRLIDVRTFQHAREYDGGSATDLGEPLAPFDLGGGGRDDLAAGAKGAVALLEATPWPELLPAATAEHSSASKRPLAIAAGDLDNDGQDEVVAAFSNGRLLLIHDPEACTPTSCSSPHVEELTANEVAGGEAWPSAEFGSAMIAADVGTSPGLELVVGDPLANHVAILSYDDQGGLHLERTIAEPQAQRLGASLALVSLPGVGGTRLVIGAPTTDVEGVEGAGALYVVDPADATSEPEEVALVSPEENTLLGQRLTVMPFQPAGGGAPVDVLVASGRDAVFVFFAGLAEGHEDVRTR